MTRANVRTGRTPRELRRSEPDSSDLFIHMKTFFWICLGGAFGTGLRYGMSVLTLKTLGASFPYGTLAVNIIGSFLIGVILHLGLHTEIIPPNLRMILTTGVLGGLTTYSTFNYETLQYLRHGEWLWAMGYFLATSLLCMAAGLAGISGAQWYLNK